MIKEELENRGRSSAHTFCWCDVFEENKVYYTALYHYVSVQLFVACWYDHQRQWSGASAA